MGELISEFSLERINKAGARFDIQKAQWYNQHYLRQKPHEELAGYLLSSVAEAGVECSQEKALKIVALMQDRVTFPNDFWQQGQYLFRAPEEYDPSVVAKRWTRDAVEVFTDFRNALENIDVLTAQVAREALETAAQARGIPPGKVLQALRLAITGAGGGPDLMVIMEIVGKSEVSRRIDRAIETLPVKNA